MIKEISDLKLNRVYKCVNTEFETIEEVKCLGNYGLEHNNEVYLTPANSGLTPQILSRKLRTNGEVNVFVCSNDMLNLHYILLEV